MPAPISEDEKEIYPNLYMPNSRYKSDFLHLVVGF